MRSNDEQSLRSGFDLLTGLDACDEDCGDVGCKGRCMKDVTPSSPGLCGGFAGFPCPTGSVCVDSKGDMCSPNCGGADCGGICLSTTDSESTSRPELTRQECRDRGGVVVGDIGNGAIHRDDYTCESSGEPPIGAIVPAAGAAGEPIAIEGEVCCGGGGSVGTKSIICPDGQKPIPNTFCGRGPNRVDCGEEDFCFIDPTDRFAVCCPNENNDLKEEQEAATSSAVIVKGCTSIVMLWPLIPYYY
eukprot:CAMPEP_0185800518 /NCGR_PEP_ID=MMETSP1322-20130828/923_1 /TAXON_ID=265543 /ORGANISM="Minutocellus polymorphus, Strain RCC2270" /LENGTH=244 /DNA_ID=CAMNT_0028496159 /DNA_START=133 /DNA_END=868 /DNA_ORIENTATION=+